MDFESQISVFDGEHIFAGETALKPVFHRAVHRTRYHGEKEFDRIGKTLRSGDAFTLMELLVVIVLLGVISGVVHLVFVTNWISNQDHIARVDLWQEVNEIMENVTGP